MSGRIREYDAKRLLQASGVIPTTPMLLVSSKNLQTLASLSTLPESDQWLIDTPLVVKPDVLLKRRGHKGLVLLNVTWSKALEHIQSHLDTFFTSVDAGVSTTGILSHFLIEPFVPHNEEKDEMYFAIRCLPGSDQILFSAKGGVNVGDVEHTSRKINIPLMEDGHFPVIEVKPLLQGLSSQFSEEIFEKFVKNVYKRFCNFHFSFLEINPLVFLKGGEFCVLDIAARLDPAAEFLCDGLWGHVEFPTPFGRVYCKEEMYIKDLDSKTGASLKLTVLNPYGRIWTMIAGGGASVVYADTVCELGHKEELANYGEYSGAPSEITTYEYAKTILSLVTAEGTYREEGKCLLIGGGIANFTSVAETFRGIIQAFRDFQYRLHDFKVSIYVRRGGPNYQDGLKMMREAGEQLDIPVKVYGPDTYMTDIIPFCLGAHSFNSQLSPSRKRPNNISNESFENSTVTSFPLQATLFSGTIINGSTSSSSLSIENGGSIFSSKIGSSSVTPTITATEAASQVGPTEPSMRIANSFLGIPNRQQSWHETRMEDIEKDPNFTKQVRSILAEQCSQEEAVNTVSTYVPFSKQTRCFIWGLQTRAVQEMLDFDHVCGRTKPSVVAIIYEFSVSHLRPFYFGTEEIFIPVCQTLQEAVNTYHSPDADILINFASMRSASSVVQQALNFPQIRAIAIIAEGIPERHSRQIIQAARSRGVMLIGPATVGGMKPGCFRIGNTGGSLENIMNAKLYRPGSVGLVTKSGGMLNELNNILSRTTNGTYEAIAIGGDRYPGSGMLDHVLRFERDPHISMMVVLGEVGGTGEYSLAEAIADKRITKPVVAWCVGTCAPLFATEVAFGHAGAWAGSAPEHAAAKNAALLAAGAIVPSSFQHFGETIKEVFNCLIAKGKVKSFVEPDVPRVPMDYAWAKQLGLVRKPKGFVSSISDDRGEELVYAGWPISKVVQSSMGVGGVIALLWFKRPLPDYCYRYLERVLMLTADHGPAVCGAHNAIVTARAGKDLISSLISGLCTIGDRFGGACDKAAQQFLGAYLNNMTAEHFVKDMKSHNKLIMGIGHRIKSVHNPDMRVELLKQFCKENFRKTDLINFAEAVERLTTKKKSTLILNVDGLIGVSMCDMLYGCGAFSESEAKDYIENGCINGLFVLGRSIGFIGHYLDQKRLKQGLYRHDIDDISYVLPELDRQ